VFGTADAASVTIPDSMSRGWHERAQAGRDAVTTSMGHEVLATATSSGDRVASSSAAAANIGQLVALRPAG
jgi:hypothetical protein